LSHKQDSGIPNSGIAIKEIPNQRIRGLRTEPPMSLFLRMKHPAANIGVSSSPLDRHSVLDTESSQIFWIPALVRLRRVRRCDGPAASRAR